MDHTTISIDVPDLASAVRFYTEGLGLETKKEPTKSTAILQTPNLDIYLLKKAEGTHACSESDGQRMYSRHWTPVHLDFIVSDLGAALERAVAGGASTRVAIREIGVRLRTAVIRSETGSA